jgi:hypothetical protein
VTEKRGTREPKTATVERREASVPRHGTQGASQAPGVPRYVHAHGCSAEHPNVSRRSAHPSIGVSEAKRQSPDAAMRARERVGLFDIVKNAAGDHYRLPSSRRTLVTSLPAARMRAIAASIGSNATAMWKALA